MPQYRMFSAMQRYSYPDNLPPHNRGASGAMVIVVGKENGKISLNPEGINAIIFPPATGK